MLENSRVDTSPMARYSLRSKRPTLRLRRLDKLDGRTRSAKYARELMQCWTAALTADGAELSDVQYRAIRYAACCVVLAEDGLAKLMAGDASISYSDVSRLQNSAERAIARLHLPTTTERDDDGEDEGLARALRGAK